MNKFMRHIFTPLLVVVSIAVFFILPGLTFAKMQDEIDHLLNYITTSDCIFVRNNSHHSPDKAVQHIKKKYNHLKKRIKTTEDFIKGAASKSSITGKPYMIICNDNEIATADWLGAELVRYRTQQNSQGESGDSSSKSLPASPTP